MAGNSRQNTDLTTEELLKIIDQLAQARVFRITLFGGEPLLHPDFFRIVQRIRKHPIYLSSLNTNGCLIDGDLAKKLFDYNIKSFCVSLDGSCPEVMDRMRGKGAFKQCIKGISNLLKLKAGIMLSATLTRYNISDIRNMVLLAKSLGVSVIRFNHVFCGGNAACFKNEIMIKPQEEIALIREIDDLRRQFRGFITGTYLEQKEKIDKLKDFSPAKDRVVVPACGAATIKCHIRTDGKVTPCEVIRDEVAGDLRRQSFLEIWRNSSVLNRFRRPQVVSLKDKPECQSCQYQYLCFIGHRCYPYYYPEGLKDKSLYCWKGIDLEQVYALS